MDSVKEIVGQYVDVANLQWSKTTIAAAVGTIVLGRMAWNEIQFRRVYGYADYRPAFNPMTLLGMLFGLAMDFCWDQRFTLYPKTGRELVVLKPWAWGDTVVYTNSVEIMKQIGGTGVVTPWIKPWWTMTIHTYWGGNLLASAGLEWKRHRKVMQPAFNPKTYEMVWSETLRLYNQMLVSEKFPTRPGDRVSFARFQDLTQRVALCIILSCGFGISLNWDEEDFTVKKDGYKLDDGVRTQGDNMLLVANAPQWLYKIPLPKLKSIAESTRGLGLWFNRAIARKKAELDEHVHNNDGAVDMDQLRNDIFTRLNLINYLDKKINFTDSEVIGNTWVIFFAGHETTAGTLAATFSLLAANPKEQEVLYNEVNEVMERNGTDQLSFDAYDSLPKTRAALVEALRMYPAGNVLIREATEDTVLQVPHVEKDGVRKEQSMHFPKGSILVCDMIGIQYNPRVFPNPDVFDPSRWYNATSDDAYTAFSIGPRTCIGRKFSLTEGVCWIAHIMKNFTVEPLLAEGEDLAGWKKRTLDKGNFKLSFSIGGAPLTFKRR